MYGALIMGAFAADQLTGAAGHRKPPYNLTTSWVPGPEGDRYLAGAHLDAMYPIACLYHGMTLFVASFTISGAFGIGFCGSPDNVPHLQLLAKYADEALAELEAAIDSAAAPDARLPDTTAGGSSTMTRESPGCATSARLGSR